MAERAREKIWAQLQAIQERPVNVLVMPPPIPEGEEPATLTRKASAKPIIPSEDVATAPVEVKKPGVFGRIGARISNVFSRRSNTTHVKEEEEKDQWTGWTSHWEKQK